jgi:hypothetical protein
MSIFDINYQSTGKTALPPSKRLPKWLAWIYSLLKPMQYLRDLFFDTFIGGANYNIFDAGQFYSYGDRAVWFDNTVVECLNDVPKLGSVSAPDITPENWIVVSENFIGVDERIYYNPQIIVFEWALNRWFRNETATDQIYIQTNTTYSDFFLLGDTSEYSSTMSNDTTFAMYYMGDAYTAALITDFTIFVPTALFNTLGATTQDREEAVKNIADKYNAAGIKYDIQTY